jgi:hypothetical protein
MKICMYAHYRISSQMVKSSDVKIAHVILGTNSKSTNCQFPTFSVDFVLLQYLFSICNVDAHIFQLLVSNVTLKNGFESISGEAGLPASNR